VDTAQAVSTPLIEMAYRGFAPFTRKTKGMQVLRQGQPS
jgi:hypothetical protein